jgi:hypothetical protein
MRKLSSVQVGLFCAFASVAVPVWTSGSAAHATGLIAQDLDHNTYVDAADFELLSGCLSGSGVAHNGSETCQEADTDYDGDVDMVDFGAMQECFSGTGVPGNPACGGWCVRPKADRPVGVTTNPVYSGSSANITVASSQVGANYQLRNHADNSNVGSPVAGTGNTITLQSGPLNSATTFNVLASNAALGCSVQLSATVTVTITPYVAKNKIGAHVVCGSRNGYGPFIQNCAAAGKPVAVIKCMEDFGAADEPKLYSPQTLTIGRVDTYAGYNLQGFNEHVGEDPAVFAQTLYAALSPLWSANRNRIDVWEICNEWDSHYDWQADFYIAMMDIAEQHGYRLALFGSSTGTPNESVYSHVARACARAKAHGNHILSLHEYALDPILMRDEYEQNGNRLVLRYRRLYDYLIPRGADCPLVITEAGQDGGGSFVGATLGTQVFVNDIGWYDSELRKDPYVIGCATWTLGNCGWGAVNFQDALPALTNYIITH